MRNVAFIVTSYWSYGELLIALEFARAIREEGFQPYFFVPSTHGKTVSEQGFAFTALLRGAGGINRILLQDYESRYKPDFVLLSDFLNFHFCEEHYGLSYGDLAIFSGRLGTFDNFDWTCRKRAMDTYGFRAARISDVDIEPYGFQLLPCPIVNPIRPRGKNQYPYPLIGKPLDSSDRTKNELRARLGLPLDKPITLVTSAMWQETYKAYPHVETFVRQTNRAFHRILQFAAQNGLLICVGGGQPDFAQDLPHVLYLDRVMPDRFEQYALASDLLITRNATSTSLAKLAISGVPCLLLKNSLSFVGDPPLTPGFSLTDGMKDILTGMDRCYPYRMFPVGWHSYLEPTLEGNPYLELLAEEEIFDEEGVRRRIASILEQEAVRDGIRGKAEDYRRLLAALPAPGEILDQLCAASGGTSR
ncbi:DUF6365 family protein [Gorillibacterium sp. sgz500922]|uniref:DUF6365 family protein n=1 Tax=Gorillibacterium sp. sgz500922 TaxID=3446694 RepID=UPI003F66C64D